MVDTWGFWLQNPWQVWCWSQKPQWVLGEDLGVHVAFCLQGPWILAGYRFMGGPIPQTVSSWCHRNRGPEDHASIRILMWYIIFFIVYGMEYMVYGM